jgi:hypothetical protein
VNSTFAIARLIVAGLPLQRWINGLGVAMALFGYLLADEKAEAISFLVMGMIVPLLPACYSIHILSSLAESKGGNLIPHARRQIVAGLASFTGVYATAVVVIALIAGFRPESVVVLWLQLMLGISFWSMLPFFAFKGNQGFWVVWVFVTIGMTAGPRTLGLHAGFLFIEPWPLLALLTALWTGFTAWQLRRRRGTGAARAIVHTRDGWLHDCSPASAVRALLFDYPSLRAPLLSAGAITVLVAGTFMATGFFSEQRDIRGAFIHAISMTLLLCLAAGTSGWLASMRSKRLWLRVGLARRDLFRLCEREAWKYFAAMTPMTLVALVLGWFVSPADGPRLTQIFVCQLGGGAAFFYLGLMHVRGWRAADFVGGLLALGAWLVALTGAPIFSQVVPQVPDGLWLLCPLIVALRVLASWRWERIDWLVCKPAGIRMTPVG